MSGLQMIGPVSNRGDKAFGLALFSPPDEEVLKALKLGKITLRPTGKAKGKVDPTAKVVRGTQANLEQFHANRVAKMFDWELGDIHAEQRLRERASGKPQPDYDRFGNERVYRSVKPKPRPQVPTAKPASGLRAIGAAPTPKAISARMAPKPAANIRLVHSRPSQIGDMPRLKLPDYMRHLKVVKRYGISKARGDRDYTGAATGTGAALATTGLVGGGIPGARPNSGRLAQVNRRGGKVEVTRHLVSAGRGGIFGYRADAHQRFLNAQMADEASHGGKPTSRVNHFLRGRGTGKIEPEKQIIRHMRIGRVGSNVALGTGAALVGAGNLRPKKVNKRSSDYKADTLISGGATTAALGGAGGLALRHQGRKWAEKSKASMDAAQKLNPKLGGYTVRQTRHGVPDVVPERSSGHNVHEHKRVFAGRSSKATEAAGRLRGEAGQQRYFAGVYGKIGQTSRKVGVGGALVGAAGVGAKYLEPRPHGVNKAYVIRLRPPGKANLLEHQGPRVRSISADPHAGLRSIARWTNRTGKKMSVGTHNQLLRLEERNGGKAARVIHPETRYGAHEVAQQSYDYQPGRRVSKSIPHMQAVEMAQRFTAKGKHGAAARAMGLSRRIQADRPNARAFDRRLMLDKLAYRHEMANALTEAGMKSSPPKRSVVKIDTTMSDADAQRLATRYDTRGPLPKKLSRPARMKAYEARYIASGGKQGEKWQRRANAAEVSRNIGLAGATAGAALTLAGRNRKLRPHLAKIKVTHHRADNAALGAAAFGGASELYGEHARSRRASFRNSPAGVAGSALSRMQAYTPEKKKP